MSKQRPRPPREAARHPFHPELPAPSRQARDPIFILTLADQKKRLGELLHADCQLDELVLLRSYVKKCFPFPVNVEWIDPDVEQPKPVEVCCLGLKEEYDRRGLLIKCSIPGSDLTRMIPLEQLRGVLVDEANWDENDPVKIAGRIISDYQFWINELHGLDPSTSGFYSGDEGDGGGADGLFGFGGGSHGGGMEFLGDGSYESSYYSDEEDGSNVDDMVFGSEDPYEDLSSNALAELEGELAEVDELGLDQRGGGVDGDEDENDDGINEGIESFSDEDGLFPFLGDDEDEEDEKHWKIDYDDDLEDVYLSGMVKENDKKDKNGEDEPDKPKDDDDDEGGEEDGNGRPRRRRRVDDAEYNAAQAGLVVEMIVE